MQYILLGINILLLVLGQIMWKIASGQIYFQLSYRGFISCILNPYFIAGGILYAAATIFWLYLLSQKQLSDIYPLHSLCYPVASVIGILFFNETITINKTIGLSMISLGAVFMNTRL